MNECWFAELGTIDYQSALDLQTNLVALRLASKIPDVLLLLEHPHIYTTGRRFNPSHLLVSHEEMKEWGVSFISTDRGGDITYHGPGQLVGYPIMQIGSITNIKDYLANLEEVLIRTIGDFGIEASRMPGYPGVWFGFEKLAAVGLRVSHGVTKHGFALNVSTDLSYFCGIVPCGLHNMGTTSIAKILERDVPLPLVQKMVIKNFSLVFGLKMKPVKKESILEIGYEDVG